MLKHVAYRSSSALGRPSELNSCRNNSIVSETTSPLKEDLKSAVSLPNATPPSPAVENGSLPRTPYSGKRDLMTRNLENLSLSHFQTPDSVSLTSALSYSSLNHAGKYSSLTLDKYSSLGHPGKYSSRCSSTISLNDQQSHSTIAVKVYLRRLRPDMEYKTVSLSSQTTCRDLILSLLTKFRLRHRDPKLFFVLMEVTVRSPSDNAPVRRMLVLDDNSRPAELQQCRPKGEANFSIGVRRGGLVRVHDSILSPGSQYKSLLVSYHTSAEDIVQLLLNCCNSKENPKLFCLHEICRSPSFKDRQLRPDECPIQTQSAWPKEGQYAFVLRRNLSYTLSLKSKLSWRRSLDQSSTDTESEIEDHNTTRASIMSTSSNVSNFSSISASSCASTLSTGSSTSGISSDGSSTCSSSGVSSGESFSSSPSHSPIKPKCTSTPTGKAEEFTAKFTAIRPPRPVPRTLFPPLPKTSANKLEDIPSPVYENDDGETLPSPVMEKIPEPSRPKLPSPVIEKVLEPSRPNVTAANDSGIAVTTPTKSSLEEILPKKEVEQVVERLSTGTEVKDTEIQKGLTPSSSSLSFVSRYRSSPKIATIRSLSKSSFNVSALSSISNKSKSYHNLSSFVSDSPPSHASKSATLQSTRRRFSNEWHSPFKSRHLSISSSGANTLEKDHHCARNCENCFYI